MPITRIQKLKDYRIFRDFTWPKNGLPDFKKFNLIYGWNGTGKTSLSNLFRQLQEKKNPFEGEFSIAVDGDHTVTQANLAEAILPQIRVFNRDSVKASVFEVPDQTLPPVYYLGEESAETQKKIEGLKVQLEEVSQSVRTSSSRLERRRGELEAFCTEKARNIKNLLTVSGGGPYNNYNAGNFKATADSLLAVSPVKPIDAVTKSEYLAIRASLPMGRIDKPVAQYPDFIHLTQKVGELLGRSVVSTVLDELRDQPDVAHWVSEGLRLHKGDHESKHCRFCGEQIPTERLAKLEGHFNKAYSDFQTEIESLARTVAGHQQFVGSIKLPVKDLLYPNFREAYSKAVQTCTTQAGLVTQYLAVMEKALAAKRDTPFKRLTIDPFLSEYSVRDTPDGGWMTLLKVIATAGTAIGATIGKSAFEQACHYIDEHNTYSDQYDQKVLNAQHALARDAVVENLEDYRAKKEAIAGLRSAVETSTTLQRGYGDEIQALERTIRHHQPAAEELTKDMQSYLGRDELKFEAKDNGYRITRNGMAAMHLSEGERTAIAFMYFLKSLQDTGFDLKTGIVVIDDPVSSLDANSLYCAFGFMKSRIQDAAQIFVLTHNFTFFRQVKNWFDHVEKRPKNKGHDLSDLKKVGFYMLRDEPNTDRRCTKLTLLDPLLHQFESEYHHLFHLVLTASKSVGETRMEGTYALPNSSRRLLEAIFAFKQPGKAGDLFQQLREIEFDEAKKARIIRFTNTYSHHGLIAEQTHDLSVLSEASHVMRDVLELVETLDAEHFKAMLELCEQQAATPNTENGQVAG